MGTAAVATTFCYTLIDAYLVVLLLMIRLVLTIYEDVTCMVIYLLFLYASVY